MIKIKSKGLHGKNVVEVTEQPIKTRQLILILVVLLVLAGIQDVITSAEENEAAEKTWRFHPPEHYVVNDKDRAERIDRQREIMDFRYFSEYMTTVNENAEQIVLTRQTHQIVFSRNSCSIVRVTILGEVMDRGCDLANLKIVDGEGRTFWQSEATDGDLTVNDEKFNTLLYGTFTPRTTIGEEFRARFKVTYDLHKMSGLISVRLCRVPRKTLPTGPTIEASLGIGKSDDVLSEVNEVTFVNTLGLTEMPLDVYQHYYYKDEQERVRGPYEYEVKTESDRVFGSGKMPYAFWTNGKLGFEVMPTKESWTQLDVERGTSGDRYVTIRMQNGKRFINFNFLNRKEAVVLPGDFTASFALALMPFKKLKPRTYIASSIMRDHPAYSTPDNMERIARILAAEGITHQFNPWQTSFSKDGEEYRRRVVKIFQKYGLKIVSSLCLNIGDYLGVLKTEQLLNPEEYKRALEIIAGGPAAASTMESPEWRHYFLNYMCHEIKDMGVDGYYHDLGCPFAVTPGLPPQLEGNVTFMEEERLLYDSFGTGKFVLYHSGHQVTPTEAMATVTFPGEPLAGAGMRKIPRALSETAYNPLLIGTNVMVLDVNNTSFRMNQPDIYKQFLANGITSIIVNGPNEVVLTGPGLSNDLLGTPTDMEEDMAMIKRYFYPFKIFDISRCDFHHRYDQDYSKYVTLSNPDAKVNVYSRKNELILAATLDPDMKGSVDITLDARNLDIDSKLVYVYDVPNKRLNIIPTKKGEIQIKDVDLTLEPRIFMVRSCQDPGRPVVIWHDDNIAVGPVQFPAPGTIVEDGNFYMTVELELKACKVDGTTAHVYIYAGDHGVPCSVLPLGGETRLYDYDEEQKLVDIVVEHRGVPSVHNEPGWKSTRVVRFMDFIIN